MLSLNNILKKAAALKQRTGGCVRALCSIRYTNNVKGGMAETADSYAGLNNRKSVHINTFLKLKNMSIAILKLANKRVSFIVDKVEEVVTGMTGNPTYTTPNPTLVSVTAQAAALNTAFQDAINGGKIQKALVRTERKKMLAMMSLLTAYVQNQSGGDEMKIRSANFDVKKTPVRPGILNPPQNVRASFGKHPVGIGDTVGCRTQKTFLPR
jgi:hypothetical protein